MVKNELVRASINLHAVLRNLEDLCALDEDARSLIADADLSIRFLIPRVEPLTLSFQKGICTAARGSHVRGKMNLRFTSAEHFNQMIAGTKMPIPTRGFTHLSFLKNTFPRLAERLTAYLQPEAGRLADDPVFREKSTILTAYTAFFALAEIARLDPIGQLNAARIPDGSIAILLGDTSLQLQVDKGLIHVRKGRTERPDSMMIFDTIDTACGVLNGTLDSYACIGSGRLAVRGMIPMIDNLNKLLSQVPTYLS